MTPRRLVLLLLACCGLACEARAKPVADSVRARTPALWSDAELVSFLRVVAFTLIRDRDEVQLHSRSVPITRLARRIATEQRDLVKALDSLPAGSIATNLPDRGGAVVRAHAEALRDSAAGTSFDLRYVAAVHGTVAAVLSTLEQADSELRSPSMAPVLGRARIMARRDVEEARQLEAVLRKPRREKSRSR